MQKYDVTVGFAGHVVVTVETPEGRGAAQAEARGLVDDCLGLGDGEEFGDTETTDIFVIDTQLHDDE